ncbi:MAG: glycosyltransferase [Oscillatoriaceae bacterium SKW80]|nr:glycosyltransferase [Oscillatoriaceae bacterium SKYG93]MCX8120691.1 glycosyltransferase [Oscillatoriaceae bacterium SKW80]MDW8453771.1 glycosyltransferase [Oscillatoriaceae cyanobacterium SKYGB_i_bin93]HIK27001.1 glycosyltransferase [Oscillatoriaceae cyanobacterium M7585_C2015_266]
MSRVAFFLTALVGGGAEKIMLYLARGLVEQGIAVDLVLAKAVGPYLSEIPAGVELVDLKSKRLLLCLPKFVQYLKQKQPAALLSAVGDANFLAVWAKRLAGVPTRAVVSVHNTLSREAKNATQFKRRIEPYMARLFYPWADAIVTVSKGAAEDLARLGFSLEKVETVYNPVITPEFFAKVAQPVEHPWFLPGEPPVILGVGRLEVQKDFPTLIRGFALVRQQRPVRLMILGEGSARSALEGLVRELGLEADVALPGFVANPYAYMARSAVFVLSSLFEGLPTVLIEAMAAGVPVVSTNCESGPSEILENGRYGELVPVGDSQALAEAIARALVSPVDKAALQEKAAEFSLARAVAGYRKVLRV